MMPGVMSGIIEFISTMKKWLKPHVYLVWDTKTGKRYIGRSNGRPDYFASGKIITEVYNKRPETLIRKIVFESDDLQEVLEKEREYQQRRYDRGTWDLYYNIIVGDPSDGADLSGDKNPNFKDGALVGQYKDPTIRPPVDKIRNAARHKEWKKPNNIRDRARYYFYKGKLEKSKELFEEWQDLRMNMPASIKGNYKRERISWDKWISGLQG